jgi:hypothetical protein
LTPPARFVSTVVVRSVDVRLARAVLAASWLGACGAASSPGRDGGSEGAGACALDPTGTFTFHVHNAGAQVLLLELGCGASLPISLATPAGRLSIGPGSVDVCGFTCDEIYAGHVSPGACSDCGGGDFKSLAPGDVADIPWDRRVYAAHTLDAACSTQPGTCAFGFAVAPSSAQLGVVTSCPVDQHPTGSCLAPVANEFTSDTTGAAATIDVGP